VHDHRNRGIRDEWTLACTMHPHGCSRKSDGVMCDGRGLVKARIVQCAANADGACVARRPDRFFDCMHDGGVKW
jgi:hypothetical protein